jgi:hypothetical protein
MAAASRPRSMRQRALGAALLALCLSATALPTQADVFIVVPTASSVKAMTQKELVDLYMGRSRAFPDGTFALPFDLPRDDPGRATFYRALTGLDLAQINSYWSRLMFSGQTLPPQPLPTEAAMVDLVKRNPSAVGYMLQEPPADKGLRVVLVLKSAK